MKLKKVTARSMNILKKHGYFNMETDTKTRHNVQIDIATDSKKVKEIAEAIFDENFKDQDWNEFDLSAMRQGIDDFLAQWYGPTKKSEKPGKTSLVN